MGPNEWQSAFERAFAEAKEVLPVRKAAPKKPWISSTTLRFIDERRVAAAAGDW